MYNIKTRCSVRGGANRAVLNRIRQTGDIFFAESDRDWILDGASVHISMIGFDDGSDKGRLLNGIAVTSINANLTSVADVTRAKRLAANLGMVFIGTKKAGDFNIPESLALEKLLLPNPHGKPNSDLLCPWLNGSAIVKRQSNQWIIDTGVALEIDEFALYESLYSHVLKYVTVHSTTFAVLVSFTN